MFGAIRLMRIAGIEVRLDWSLLIVFALVTMSLGGGVFPSWHPDWSAATVWITAALAAVLFLASVLLHELSHALVGRRHGVDIRRITLFVFGGMAHLEREPDTWRAELYMALVGPLVSLAIGIGCLLAVSIGMDLTSAPETPEQALAVLGTLSPAATLLAWLGPVNVTLALFNLVPAFPLDGGRVLRAALWGRTGDLGRATRLAASIGQAFAWVLIAAGVAMLLGLRVPIFGAGTVGGLWLALIGWFLHNASIASYRQTVAREALHGVRVADVMRTRIQTVPSDLPVIVLVEEHIMGGDQRSFPVVDGAQLRGVVSLEDVRRTPRERWPQTSVGQIMTPIERLATAAPGDAALDALEAIGRRGINQLPVVENGALRGVLTREDVLKWLAVFGRDLSGGPPRSLDVPG